VIVRSIVIGRTVDQSLFKLSFQNALFLLWVRCVLRTTGETGVIKTYHLMHH